MNHWEIARSEFEDDFERLARSEADTETEIVLAAEDYDALVRRLDEPARVPPGLRRLFEHSSIWREANEFR